MGFFSWKCAITGESISNVYSPRGAKPCVVLNPQGEDICDFEYEGYGDFGGQDIYALLDIWNGGEGDRNKGIKMDCARDGSQPRFPIKIVTADAYDNGDVTYANTKGSPHCEHQGFFYD